MSVVAEDFGSAARNCVSGNDACVLHVDRMQMLKNKVLDVVVFLALSGSVMGVVCLDLWVLLKLSHLIFG
jgi:hypothetical protein